MVLVLGLYSDFASRAVKRKRFFFEGVGVPSQKRLPDFLAFAGGYPDRLHLTA
jgi:hypothetical protein